MFRIIELGGKIATPGLSMLVRRLGEVSVDRAGRAPASLLGLSVREWCQQIQRGVHRRSGRLPAATTMNTIRRLLTRMMRLLVTACDTGPWWQRDQWNPVEDNRIPLRDHEPMGRYSVRFDRIDIRWLRRGLQWHCKVGLDTGTLGWSTVHRRIVAVGEFDGFLAGRGVEGPWLADHPAGMRALMLDFLGHLRARVVTRGRRAGQRLTPASVQRLASDVEQFYLFMTDLVTGWTENCSIRNNAAKWIIEGIEELQQRFPFAMVIFDSDCGAEFINHEVAAWLQAKDVAQTRSRPYQKNDQAHVESKNNHVVRKHAFYWRYDTPVELELLNRLWQLVSLRLNFFTPTKKAVGYTTTADGRRKRIYDKPVTPWQRLQTSGVLGAEHLSKVAARIEGINPADLTRQINAIQMQLLDLAKTKTDALAAARHIDLEALQPSINRLATAK